MATAVKKTSKVKIGTQFRSVYADGNPLWKVIKKEGRRTWLCEIVSEKIKIGGKEYDSDFAGARQAFLTSDIELALADKEFWGGIEDNNKKFYASLVDGDIVHYHNGFDQYVRCEVRGGELLPIALVGSWKDYDLPFRQIDGEIYFPHYVHMINTKISFTPNASNIWEHNKSGKLNPTKMKPIDLSVRGITYEEEQLAESVKVSERVRVLLEVPNCEKKDMNKQMIVNLRSAKNELTNFFENKE